MNNLLTTIDIINIIMIKFIIKMMNDNNLKYMK